MGVERATKSKKTNKSERAIEEEKTNLFERARL